MKLTLPKGTEIPNHIAIICDGNGRWARSRGLPVTRGHEYGARALSEVMRAARDIGVHTVTVWGFSTENWKRPPKEKAKIFSLMKSYLDRELEEAIKEGVRIVHIGRKDRLPKELSRKIALAENETRENSKYLLNIAIDYGGHDEILRAVRGVIEDGVKVSELSEDLFSSYLDTAGEPYPYVDLLIRTSGEMRTSGYMPWQLAYAEFYFEDVHLPDITPELLKKAILDYSRRRRRLGGKDKVKHFTFKPEVVANLELAWWRLGNIPPGERFRDYAVRHIKEQFGLSAGLAKEASGYLYDSLVLGEQSKWPKAKSALKKFYKLVRDEVKLAFEPSIVASLEVKMLKDMKNPQASEQAEMEETARELYAEVYRISLLQAGKLAHLRVLANLERALAERGMGEKHWKNAEDYLEKFYRELKNRVA